MIRMKFYLDDRATAENAVASIKIRFTFKKKPIMVSTGIRVLPKQWDDSKQCIINHTKKKQLNDFLQTRMTQISSQIIELEMTHKLNNYSPSELKSLLEGKSIATRDNFVAFFTKYYEAKPILGTRQSYALTLSRLHSFDTELDTRVLSDINVDYIRRFDTFLAQTCRRNARNVHHRNIRAAINGAIDEELTTIYPYRKFRIKQEATRKRALSVEELRMLRDFPVEEHIQKYRDMFMLSFYLIGINAVDLFSLPKDALHNERIDYTRAKTHKQYSIKVEPEAMEIIQRYAGTDHLINILDERTRYRDFQHRMNDGLKCIGAVARVGRGGRKVYQPMFPDLSQYWARHTWASIASELDIPKETIAAGLGHGSNSVTDIYIKYDYRKVDAANRKIIDYVNSSDTGTAQQ